MWDEIHVREDRIAYDNRIERDVSIVEFLAEDLPGECDCKWTHEDRRLHVENEFLEKNSEINLFFRVSFEILILIWLRNWNHAELHHLRSNHLFQVAFLHLWRCFRIDFHFLFWNLSECDKEFEFRLIFLIHFELLEIEFNNLIKVFRILFQISCQL